MIPALRLICMLWSALALAACTTVAPPRDPAAATTILISIDGFRPDYLDRGVTPKLSALAADGVRGSMRPSFPSKTFPNHYTLDTGLRPDRHGVVDNTMEDPTLPGVTFRLSNKAAVTDAAWWNDATPIWVSAERAGVRSATMFWPGSEAAIQGVRPSLWAAFDQTKTSAARTDQVLAWLDLPPDRRPRLVTLYFDLVDTAGHDAGPDSAQVNAAAAEVDAAVGRLVDGLSARGVRANLVITADHGMAATSPDRRIFADDVLPAGAARTPAMGAYMTVAPNAGREAEVERALLRPHPRMQCWRKGDIPARYHFGTHRRIPPIFCLPQTGWEITTRDFAARQTRPSLGAHGFDPFDPEMAAIFVAHGPAFRRGVTLRRFDNVSVYPLLARLTGVRPEPNDGHLADLREALAP